MMPKIRHIKKLIKVLRVGNLKHLYDRKLIQWVPNLQCNLNCQMCHQKDIRMRCEPNLELNEIAIMLDNLKKVGVTQINICGGEFFIFKDRAFKILDMMEDRGILFSIATNSVLLEPKDISKLVRYWGIMEMDISLDGFQETHDKIRGRSGAFKKTVKNIKIIKAYGIPVMVVCVVQKDNLMRLPEFVEYVHSLKVDSMTLVQEFSVTHKDFDDSLTILKSISVKPCDIFASTTVDAIAFKYDYELFKGKVNDAKRKAEELGLELNTSFELERGDKNIFEYIYDKTVRKTHNVYCNELNCGQIDWTGQLNICPFIRINGVDGANATGVIDNNYFENPELIKIIETIKKQNLLPICTRCCSLKVGDHK